MPKTNTLRIWSHVRQVGPLSAIANGDAWFAFNLAPVLVDDNGAFEVNSDLTKKYLWPWTWEWSELRLALLIKGVVQSVIIVPAAQILREAPLANLNDEFVAEWSAVAQNFTAACFIEKLTDPTPTATLSKDTPRDWKLFLYHASSFPGDIALRTGLAAFFHVPYAQLGNVDEIIVAPVFADAPFSTKRTPLVPSANCLDLSKPASGCPLLRMAPNLVTPALPQPRYVTRWMYDAPAAGELQIHWIEPYTPVRIPNTDSWTHGWEVFDDFIHEDTLWVTQPGFVEPNVDQGQDWHEHLESRVANLFDLPLRLLEWANQPGMVPDDRFGDAFVASLRDLVQPGYLTRPDGGTLALDVAGIIAPQQPAKLVGLLSQFAAQYNQLDHWLQRLTDFLKNTTGQFGENELSADWKKPSADMPSYLARLNKVRNTLLAQDVLRSYIEREWSDALTSAGSPLWTPEVASNVDDYLQSMDLLTTLRLGFLGMAWMKQKGAWYDRKNIVATMTIALTNIYRERLGLQTQAGWGYNTLLPRADGATSAKQASIEQYLKSFIDQWAASAIGPQPSDDEMPDYSGGNQGIKVQFSNFGCKNDNDDDFLGHLRGACVMLRPSASKPDGTRYPWSILNLGQMSVRGEALRENGILKAPPFDPKRVCVSPWQICYRNGQLQVSCTYKNQPLSARSPASDLSKVQKVKSLNNGADDHAGIFELWNPYRDASPYRLARLIFGQPYEAAAFAVGFAGEMPKEICDPAKPWRVSLDPSTWSAPNVKTDIPYLRTVPIGLVRVEGPDSRPAGEDMARLAVPPIPEGVYPIARSIRPLDSQKDTLLLLSDVDSGQWNVQATRNAEFAIRPPATDLATWDSWPLASPSPRERAAIYSFLAQNSDIKNDASKSAAVDLTLDDPAVTGFELGLECEYAPPGSPKPAYRTQSFDIRRNGASLLQKYQSTAAKVTITVGDTDLKVPKVAADPYEVTVKVPAGHVFKLSIRPVLAPDANSRFATVLQKKALVEPRTFYIEVATSFVFDRATVSDLLNGALTLSSKPPLEVGLDLGKLGDFGHKIHRVELMIQRWRWQGRPLARLDNLSQQPSWSANKNYRAGEHIQATVDGNTYIFQSIEGGVSGADVPVFPTTLDATVKDHTVVWKNITNTIFAFPFEATGHVGWPDKLLEPLDGLYFGERDSNDHLLVTAQADALAPNAANPRLYFNDLTGSPQALYYRFAVRVFSRYEGLLRGITSAESRLASPQLVVNLQPPPELWRRWVANCRRTSRANAPAVRLVIPLTQTRDQEQTPGLLVVVDEPWFEWAGLAEGLNARIVSATDPNGTELAEAGADPAVSNPANSGPAAIEQRLLPVGPIGFTFDTNTSAPIFDKSSFLLPAPRTMKPDGALIQADLSWWFLKLQFQRSLQPEGTDAYSPDLDSPWTAPLEAQLLPAANLWYVEGHGRQECSRLRFSFTSTGSNILMNGVPATVNPTPHETTSTNLFEVWALLTSSIQDAFGRPSQEAFVDLIPISTLSAYRGTAGKSMPAIARLVEIQRMGPYSKQQGDWRKLAEDLFPKEITPEQDKPAQNAQDPIDPAMARARIVRVSPPISAA